jgi:hypothetical protein
MSRTTRRRAVRAVAPVAGLLAAGLLVWQGSYAAFSATTTSPTNAWATGQVTLKNNTNGAYQPVGVAAFSVSNMTPSATAGVKCITVESSGSLAGAVKLYTANVTASTPGTNQVSSNIIVTITEMTTGVTSNNVAANCTGFVAGPVIANGLALNALPTGYGAGLGSFAPTGAATQYAAYKISYVFNPGPAVTDVQGKTANADFVWEIQTT